MAGPLDPLSRTAAGVAPREVGADDLHHIVAASMINW